MTRDRLAWLRAESARGPLTQVEVGELLDAVEQSFGAVESERMICERIAGEECGRENLASNVYEAIRARKAGR